MKLKLDENLSRALKASLSARGHDVLSASDEGLLSQPDSVIGAAAKQEGRIILTLDLDFADLRQFPPGTHPGIVLFRPASLGPLTVNKFIEDFVDRYDPTVFPGCVVVVEPMRIRVRRPGQ